MPGQAAGDGCPTGTVQAKRSTAALATIFLGVWQWQLLNRSGCRLAVPLLVPTSGRQFLLVPRAASRGLSSPALHPPCGGGRRCAAAFSPSILT